MKQQINILSKLAVLLLLFTVSIQAQAGDTTIRKGGSIVGRIESNGDVRINGSIKGRFESNGDIRVNGSIVGKIESTGDVRKSGSIIGRAEQMTNPRQVAVLFFYGFFDL